MIVVMAPALLNSTSSGLVAGTVFRVTVPPEGEQKKSRNQRQDCHKPHKG